MTVTTTVGLAIVLPVACWLATGVRRVPAGERVLVLRRGVVRRVHDSGAALRLPFLESFETASVEPLHLPLMVRGATADGVRVLVLAEATVTLPAPQPGTAYADPWRVAEVTAQETIARDVATWSSVDLRQAAVVAQRPLRHAVSAAVDEHGVTLLDLELVEVDVQLDEGAFDRGRR